MVFCKNCQHELPEGSRFCGLCGSKLELKQEKEGDSSEKHTVIGMVGIPAMLASTAETNARTESPQDELAKLKEQIEAGRRAAEALAKLEEAERKAQEEAERKAQEEAERKAQEEAEARIAEVQRLAEQARAEAEAKLAEAQRLAEQARAEAEAKLAEAERLAKEAAEIAERKSREERERKAREEFAQKAQEETKPNKREAAEQKANKETKQKLLSSQKEFLASTGMLSSSLLESVSLEEVDEDGWDASWTMPVPSSVQDKAGSIEVPLQDGSFQIDFSKEAEASKTASDKPAEPKRSDQAAAPSASQAESANKAEAKGEEKRLKKPKKQKNKAQKGEQRESFESIEVKDELPKLPPTLLLGPDDDDEDEDEDFDFDTVSEENFFGGPMSQVLPSVEWRQKASVKKGSNLFFIIGIVLLLLLIVAIVWALGLF